MAAVHLEFFHSVADIARAKYELVASLPMGGTAILNADDEYVSQFGRDFHGKVVTISALALLADVWADILSRMARRDRLSISSLGVTANM